MMSMVIFGCVSEGNDKPKFKSNERFIALVDILGMGIWTRYEKADSIAYQVNCAVQDAIEQASCGSVDGVPIGPLVGTAMFSDSILLYSPDCSWHSFSILCSTVGTLIGISLSKGVPLRGALSQGDVVIDPKKSLYIGSALHDACSADAKMNYRGVGVKITENTLGFLNDLYQKIPVPQEIRHEGIDDFFSAGKNKTNILCKFNDEVFLNHWHGPFFKSRGDFDIVKKHLEKCFYQRELPSDKEVDSKYEQTLEFMRQTLFIEKTIEEVMTEAFKMSESIFGSDTNEAYKQALLKLNELSDLG
ncbi:MAG: hypothetical protein ACUZ8N_07180 [Candidatus Scalindua sp.]